ncbi:hypothetical protein BG58_25140 [Caballeronia jiangsuensis]|nr:hypothetical protein BG58_25140 [Caballeronia jiangsuensis]
MIRTTAIESDAHSTFMLSVGNCIGKRYCQAQQLENFLRSNFFRAGRHCHDETNPCLKRIEMTIKAMKASVFSPVESLTTREREVMK